jgi:uncharacterized membrane protein
MKKIGVLLLVALLVVSFGLVVADNHDDAPSVPGGLGEDRVEQFNKAQANFSPINEEGDIDFGKYRPYKSKAEERIKGINQWIKDNASWLGVVFGMVPEISWLFALNLYVVLFFFMSLVLNGHTMWIFLSEKKARLFGLGVFAVLLVTKFFLNVLVMPTYKFWGIVYEYGWWAILLFWIVLIVLLIFFPKVLRKIHVSLKMRRRKAAKEQEKLDREVTHKFAEGVSG